MKRNRTLPILLGLFGILAVVYLVQSFATPLPGAIENDFRLERVFPDLAVLDILAVRLQNPVNGEAFTITRTQEGVWTTEDREGTLDTEAATGIARTLALLPYERVITDVNDDDMASYGFGEGGHLFVQVLLTDGRNYGIAVGGLAPSEENYYAVVDQRVNIYLVSRGPIDFLLNYLASPPVLIATQAPRATFTPLANLDTRVVTPSPTP